MRKGTRYISDSEPVFLAESAGIDPEMALLGCHVDRNENPQIKQMWEHIAKKVQRARIKSNFNDLCGISADGSYPK